MLKILFFLSSIFNLSNYIELNKGNNVSDASRYSEVCINDNNYLNAIKVSNDYVVELIGDEYIVKNNITSKTIYTTKFKDVNIISYQQKLVIADYYEDKLYIATFENEELKTTQEVYQGSVSNIYLVYNEGFYLFYNNLENSVKILNLGTNETKTYGGTLNEYLYEVKVYKKQFYLVIYKDSLSGGDFGYGGTNMAYVICIINNKLSILNYITLDCSGKYFNMDVNERIYITIENYLYVFDSNLVFFNKLLLNNFKFISCGVNNLIIIFYNSYYEIVDSLTLNVLKTVNEDYSNLEINEFDEFIYLKQIQKGYIFDLISFDKINLNYYSKLKDEDYHEVYSLFNKVKFIQRTYLETYNQSIFGTYNIEVEYQTKKFNFILKTKEIIPLNVNVYNDMIYPEGYRILFNGNGLLDGYVVVNNYPITSIGIHNLVVSGVNEIASIQFKIMRNQISFTDEITKTQKTSGVNQDIRLTYNVSGSLQTEDIVNIDINTEVYDYYISEAVLYIFIKGYPSTGIYDVFLNSITYKIKYGNELFFENTEYLNFSYKINVLKNSPTLTFLNIDSNLIINYDCIDEFKTLRCIEVEIYNNFENFYYLFPIADNKLIIPNKGEYYGIINLVINKGSDAFERIELMTFTVENQNEAFEVGAISIKQLTQSLDKFSIQLSKQLSKVTINNQTITITNDTNNFYMITTIFGILLVFSGIVTGFLIRRKRINKKYSKVV